MTTRISTSGYKAIVAAINKEPYDKATFASAVRSHCMSSGVRPDWVNYPDFPSTLLAEWRADKAWSLAHLDRHQAGCDAMWPAYWSAFSDAPSTTPLPATDCTPAGMTLRDEFAAKAMQGLLAADAALTMSPDEMAALAFDQADAMLAARRSS